MGRIFLALVALACTCTAFPSPEPVRNVSRVVAIGDVHGDFERFTQVLKMAGLVSDGLKWTGGRTQLVQMGDVPDRGPDSRQVLDLLMALEGQARRAG